MGFGSHYVSSPGWCFSIEDYKEYIKKHYHNTDDDEKLNPNWFYLPFGHECGKYMEFANNKCSQYLSHGVLVTCNYCQNIFRTLTSRDVRWSACYWSIERK